MESSDGRIGADFIDLILGERDDAVLVVERPTRVVRACNDAVARVFGYAPAELIGGSIRRLHVDDTHFRDFGAMIDREIARGGTPRCRYPVRHRDGRIIEVAYVVVPIVDRSGTVTASVSVVRDIGNAEHRRRLLDLVVNAVPVAIAVTQIEDGRLILANQPCREMLGFGGDDDSAPENMTVFYADQADRAALIDTLKRGDAVINRLLRLRRRDGSPFWASASLRLISLGGETVVFGSFTDITREHEAREAAERSRGLLQSFIDNAPGHVFLKDLDGRYLLVNRGFRERISPIFGDPIGQDGRALFSTEDARATRAHDEDVIRTRTAVTRELELTRPGDDRRMLRVTKFPFLDAAGELSAIGVISLDITAERAASETMEQIRRNLEAIVDNAPAHIFLKDRNRNYILQNRSHREDRANAGYGPSDLASHRLHTPEDTAKLKAMDDEVLRTGAAVAAEIAVTRKTSGRRVIRVTKFPVLGERGEVSAIGGITLDVTTEHAAREAEQKTRRLLESIIDNAPAHIFLKDLENRFVLVNRSLRRRLAPFIDEPVGNRADMHLPPEDAAKFARQDAEVIRTRSVVSDEVTVTAHGSHPVIYRSTKFPVLDNSGRVTAIGGISLDITGQRQLEERARHSQKLEAIGQLTGGIAHDFNNLLEVILGNAEMLIEDLGGDPARRRMAELVRTAAERAAALTNRMLAFSRQQDLHPDAVDCGDMLQSLTKMLTRTLGEDIDLRCAFAPGPSSVWVDRSAFESCLVNLIVNARDAMPSGGSIHVRIENVSFGGVAGALPANDLPPGDYVRIAVADSGTGMAPEVLKRAFDPYFTTKEVGKGTGLGLSMVHGFVRQSGGHVVIDSTVGVGTIVTIHLPRLARSSDARPPPDADTTVTASAVLPTGTETVLVVEDEAMVRNYVAAELDRLGYHVIEACNGREALSALRTDPTISLLFTDVVMPGGMRGNELAHQARAIRPDLKVLFTTGYASATVGEALADDDVTVLYKPYPRRDLADYVRRCLDAV